MKLTKIDLQILIEIINKEYEDVYFEYKQKDNSQNFSRLIDIENLKRKLHEMIGEIYGRI